MCLILLSHNDHPTYKLVVAANRDEFYGRPTAPAAFWEDHGHILAGRDQKQGGTWMGVTRHGRWAAVTNYRDPSTQKEHARSRGHLVADYLRARSTPEAYLHQVAQESNRYRGFNILVGRPDQLGYYSNRDGAVRMLEPGCYGLSNHLLDTGWPKVERGRKNFERHSVKRRYRPKPCWICCTTPQNLQMNTFPTPASGSLVSVCSRRCSSRATRTARAVQPFCFSTRRGTLPSQSARLRRDARP